MSPPSSPSLQTEWVALHASHERYEFGALAIKLVAVVLFFGALVLALNDVLTGAIVLMLWLQEGVWKTFQARLGERIGRVEQLMSAEGNGDSGAFRLHTEFNLNRRRGVAALLEYAKNALRPTVAIPYALLLLLLIALYLGGVETGPAPV